MDAGVAPEEGEMRRDGKGWVGPEERRAGKAKRWLKTEKDGHTFCHVISCSTGIRRRKRKPARWVEK